MTDTPLRCDELFALLSAYLDGELTPEMTESISRHIAGCEPCVAFIASLERSIALCKQPLLEVPEMPAELRRELKALFESQQADAVK